MTTGLATTVAGRTVRPIEIGRGLWGASLLCAPEALMTHVHKVTVDRPGVVVARILGARQLAQAVLSGISPSREVLAMGVWVDGAHALTAVGLAVADRSRARAGLTDAAIATGWALLGWYDLADPRAQDRRHDRIRDTLARAVLRLVPGGGPLLRRARVHRSG